MFQLRICLVTLHNRIHSLKIDILSILYQVSVMSSQKLTPSLIKPLDLISLLIKLEAKLVSHPRLSLPEWKGENIWYTYKLMKLQSFMMSDTLYVVLHFPLVDKSLWFHLLRIHIIPLVHPVLKTSFRYSIQENCLAIRLDKQYISFPLSTDIMACQVSYGQFCHINSPCMQQILHSILSVISQMQDEAFNINDNFGAISTLKNKKSII